MASLHAMSIPSGTTSSPRASACTRRSSAAAEQGVDQVGEIVPVQSPRREAVAAASGVGRRPIREPAGEMPRIVGKGAHVGGADVQQMIRVVGRVGDTGAEFGAALDQHDLEGPGLAAQKVNGEEHAAGASPDDDDARHSNVALQSNIMLSKDPCRPLGFLI